MFKKQFQWDLWIDALSFLQQHVLFVEPLGQMLENIQKLRVKIPDNELNGLMETVH